MKLQRRLKRIRLKDLGAAHSFLQIGYHREVKQEEPVRDFLNRTSDYGVYLKNHHIGDIILDEEAIAAGVRRVAERLNQDFADAVVITVVPGGILYTADLTRQLTFDVSMDYISCPHTPGERNNNSTIVYHHNIEIAGRHVIIIDDAIESGGTMKRLVEYISENYQPASVSIAVLFVKPGRVDIPVKQYYAYEMESDDLLIGYGMPWDNKYRNRPNVAKLIK